MIVGTSTGGPPALDALLSPLSADFPWPILVAQHMPATFTGPLARRLDRLSALNVQEVTQPTPLTVGNVYIGKGDADIIVVMRGEIPFVTSAPALAEHRWHPSVDRLVTSAIQHLGAGRLVGVLMTGMGNDGATAMSRLRSEGGRTIAEAEETAVVWGMPGELVKAGGAEVVAPVDKIATQLGGLGTMSKPVFPYLSTGDLNRFCEFLYKRTGILYGESKRFYIERRLQERMTKVGVCEFPSYFAILQSGGPEAEQLINSITVNETYFYREDSSALLSHSLAASRNR